MCSDQEPLPNWGDFSCQTAFGKVGGIAPRPPGHMSTLYSVSALDILGRTSLNNPLRFDRTGPPDPLSQKVKRPRVGAQGRHI